MAFPARSSEPFETLYAHSGAFGGFRGFTVRSLPRPIEAFSAASCNGCFASTPAFRCASGPVLRGRSHARREGLGNSRKSRHITTVERTQSRSSSSVCPDRKGSPTRWTCRPSGANASCAIRPLAGRRSRSDRSKRRPPARSVPVESGGALMPPARAETPGRTTDT